MTTGPKGIQVSDIFRKEMMAAGERFSHALQLEHYFNGIFQPDQNTAPAPPQPLKDVRRLVEQTASDYAAAIERYRDACLQAASSESASNEPAEYVGLSALPSRRPGPDRW